MNKQFDKVDMPNEEILSTYATKAPKDTHKMFSIDEPEFDTSTYFGRFRRNRLITNPLIAFYSN